MAKIGSRVYSERTRLETVIPLDTPYILFLDPSSMCNLACNFCPCGGAHKELWQDNKKVGMMSYELFRKIIDDVARFPRKLKTLRLYKEGEPLVNPRFPDMVRYAKEREIADKIDTTSNGILLKHDLALAIIDAGLDRINISIEALSKEEYFNICGAKIDFDEFLENLKFLYENKKQCHIFIKTTDKSLGNHTEDEFYRLFGNICDEMSIEKVTPVWPEFNLGLEYGDKFEKNILGGDLNSNIVCPYIFYQACINSDGTVSACLMDWNHKLIVGDLKKESIVSIWNGDKLNSIRVANLEGKRCDIPVCRECGQLKYGGVVDNIDPYREELLQKIRK